MLMYSATNGLNATDVDDVRAVLLYILFVTNLYLKKNITNTNCLDQIGTQQLDIRQSTYFISYKITSARHEHNRAKRDRNEIMFLSQTCVTSRSVPYKHDLLEYYLGKYLTNRTVESKVID